MNELKLYNFKSVEVIFPSLNLEVFRVERNPYTANISDQEKSLLRCQHLKKTTTTSMQLYFASGRNFISLSLSYSFPITKLLLLAVFTENQLTETNFIGLLPTSKLL